MDTPPPLTKSFAHHAAKLSWVCPLFMVLLSAIFAKRVSSPVIIDLVCLLLIVVGFTLGIIGLFGMRRHGPRGILGHAMAGIMINGFLIFIFITNFIAAREKAQQHTGVGTAPVAFISRQEK